MANETHPVGTTVAWGTSSFTAVAKNVSIDGVEVGDIPITNYASTAYKRYAPHPLIEPPEVTVSIDWDTAQLLPPIGTEETITITFPVPSGLSTAGSLAGTAYTKGQDVELGDADGDDPMTAEILIKYTGGTVTWTDAA